MAKSLSDHEKEKGTYFTCVTNNIECRNNIKEICKDLQYWAWIDHQPDDEEGSEHTHFLLRANGTRSVGQMASKLEISPQYVQVCRKVVAFRRYMIHKDNPEKRQYTIDDVHSNYIDSFRMSIEGDNAIKDVYSLFKSLDMLQGGRLSLDEFVQIHYVELSSMAFSQKIKTYETLSKLAKIRARTT